MIQIVSVYPSLRQEHRHLSYDHSTKLILLSQTKKWPVSVQTLRCPVFGKRWQMDFLLSVCRGSLRRVMLTWLSFNCPVQPKCCQQQNLQHFFPLSPLRAAHLKNKSQTWCKRSPRHLTRIVHSIIHHGQHSQQEHQSISASSIYSSVHSIEIYPCISLTYLLRGGGGGPISGVKPRTVLPLGHHCITTTEIYIFL